MIKKPHYSALYICVCVRFSIEVFVSLIFNIQNIINYEFTYENEKIKW